MQYAGGPSLICMYKYGTSIYRHLYIYIMSEKSIKK